MNQIQRQKPELMTDCYVAGWGNDAEGGDSHDYLQSLAVQIFSDSYCYDKSDYKEKLYMEGQFCAGYMEGGRDSCQGDSGGPLICIRDEK